MSEDLFKLRYREYMDKGGHSYDEWDISWAWDRYQTHPREYYFLHGGG